jgi:hypothetical protein
LAETLLGKQQFNLPIDRAELDRIQAELKTYGDAPGLSFFPVRDGQAKARERKLPAALASLGKAIERTPTLLAPYFIRADVLLQSGGPAGVQRDRDKINQLLTDAGGFSEGDEARAAELEVRILIETAVPARERQGGAIKRASTEGGGPPAREFGQGHRL